MSDLPRVNAPGLKVWRAVLLELLRRENQPARQRKTEPPLSISSLARLTGKSDSQVKEHLDAMVTARFISMDTRMGPQGTEVRLAGLGRLVARLLEETVGN